MRTQFFYVPKIDSALIKSKTLNEEGIQAVMWCVRNRKYRCTMKCTSYSLTDLGDIYVQYNFKIPSGKVYGLWISSKKEYTLESMGCNEVLDEE